MRILHIVPSYWPAVRYGGPIWSVHGLAKAQASAGHRVRVFTTSADGPGELDVPTDRPVDVDGVEVRYFPRRWPKRLFRAPAMLDAAGAELADTDIVHIHAMFLWPVFRMARAARAAGVPYVLSPRGMLVPALFAARSGIIKRLWMWLFDRRTVEQASALHLTASTEESELATFGYRLPPIRIIANGVDVAAEPERVPDEAAALPPGFLLSFGRINWKKNLPELVHAAAAKGQPLVIAGNDEDGDSAAILAAIAESGGDVTLIARSVDGPEKAWLLARCAAFVLPSLSENFGNVVVEAMAAGRPVIVTDQCGVTEHVAASGGGLVCGTGRQALSHAIAALFSRSGEERAAMGDAGRRYVAGRLTWPAIAGEMVALYADLADQPHA